jgi:hypothetical protein
MRFGEQEREFMINCKWVCLATVALLSTQALGVGPLASDPAALSGWHSTTSFISPNVNVNVDYAVFAPGAAGGPASVSGEFIYAFQIFGNGQPLDIFGQSYILGGFAHLSGVNPSYGTVGGTAPLLSNPGTTPSPFTTQFSASFSPPLPANGFSTVFWFSALQSPTLALNYFGNTTNFPVFSAGLAGPNPSASTFVGLLAGGAVMTGRRRRWSNATSRVSRIPPWHEDAPACARPAPGDFR